MSSIINKVKDGYLKAVDWAESHPHVMVLALGLSVISRLFV